MRKFLILLAMAVIPHCLSFANVNVSIGIEVTQYPALHRIPGYPVYYAPALHANYFFYDGLYWVYVPDGWYVSPWYNGPWDLVAIDSVPLFILRVPVRYYGYPPVTFRTWGIDAPPHWESVWGDDWSRRHSQWRHWNHASTPSPAPLPRYQSKFTQENYPSEAQRRELSRKHYNYAPHDTHVRQQLRTQLAEPGPSHHPSPPTSRARDMHPPPPHEARVFMHEPPPTRSNEQERSRNTASEHGGRPEQPQKAEKDHDHGKHH